MKGSLGGEPETLTFVLRPLGAANGSWRFASAAARGDACGRETLGVQVAGPQNQPISAARAGDHAAEPGVGDGHYLHRDGARLRLPRRGDRLVHIMAMTMMAVCRAPSEVMVTIVMAMVHYMPVPWS